MSHKAELPPLRYHRPLPVCVLLDIGEQIVDNSLEHGDVRSHHVPVFHAVDVLDCHAGILQIKFRLSQQLHQQQMRLILLPVQLDLRTAKHQKVFEQLIREVLQRESFSVGGVQIASLFLLSQGLPVAQQPEIPDQRWNAVAARSGWLPTRAFHFPCVR